MHTENTRQIQRGRPFQPGRSGNPGGRPKGARNRATIAAETLLEGEAQALTRKAVELAKGGDTMALKLCLERILPPRKDRLVSFELPPIVSADDAAKAVGAVLDAVAAGQITPSEAVTVAGLIDAKVRTMTNLTPPPIGTVQVSFVPPDSRSVVQ
jgi:hypothetical protein